MSRLEQIFQLTVLRTVSPASEGKDKYILLFNNTSYEYTDPNELYAAIANFAAARFEW